jgi:hypothetical protein
MHLFTENWQLALTTFSPTDNFFFSVADGEALSSMLGVLEFVDQGDRVILKGNTAVALCIGDQVIFAQTKFTCALTGLKECGGAKVGPVDAALLQVLEHLEVGVHDGDPFLGNVSGRTQRDARCDEETACTADHDEARSAGLLDALNEAIRSADDLVSVVRWRPIGRDDGVRALDDAGDLCRIAEVVLDCGDVLEFSHLLWSARCRDDGVTAIDQFLENDASCLACGSVENDFQLELLLILDCGCVDLEQTYSQATMAQESPIFGNGEAVSCQWEKKLSVPVASSQRGGSSINAR